MRVIAGTARGRNLRAPLKPSTRPTGDLVKGMIFSMLDAEAYKRDFEVDEEGTFAAAQAWPRVLDLFAGSGALGIEALSRGARQATFVESDREATQVLQANLRSTQLAEQATLLQQSAQTALARLREPFDLVLMDPPYDATGLADAAITTIAERGLLAPSGILVMEERISSPVRQPPPGLVELRQRHHGQTRVTLYVPAATVPAG